MPHKVLHVYAPDELPEHVVFVGPGAEITVENENLVIENSQTPDEAGALLGCTLLSRRPSPFVPGRLAPSQGCIVVTVIRRLGLHVRVVAIDERGVIHSLGECPVPLELHQVCKALIFV